MTPSYFSRLLLLSSGSFFLVFMILAAIVSWIAPAAVRRAASMRPQQAARWLLTLRLLPASLSAMVVALLCVPSYLRFEPHIPGEEAGVVCLAAALLGLSILGLALYRALSALIRSAAYLGQCDGRESQLNGEKIWIVPDGAGLALAGIVRPRLLISERAAAHLSSDQLAVALQHERAHRASRDNLKRLLIQLAPAVFPRLRTLEQAWIQCAEWAADDRATEGDPDRSTALAAALVQVARLQSGLPMPALVTSLVAADEDLAQRVNRILDAPAIAEPNRRFELFAFSSAAILIAILAMNLRMVHLLLESLLD
jgi:beta-lactamase regulating signal transducer with metallopeptidase domain